MSSTNLRVWGSNSSGELGNSTTIPVSSPISIAGVGSFAAISAGFGYSLAIDTSGMVWAWGDGTSGKLGNGNVLSVSSPTSIIRPGSYIKISAGFNSAIALDSSGNVFTWGLNTTYGQLGDNTTTNRSSPVSIRRLGSYTRVTAGSNHCHAIDGSTGMVWSWGRNSNGQLGANLVTTSSGNRSSPVSIAMPGSYIDVSAGFFHSIAIDSTGMIWAWGLNEYGQLGNDDDTNQKSPVSIARSGSYAAISAGRRHSLAIDSAGMIWAWGYNGYGQLGNNDDVDQSSPVSIARLGSYVAISAGSDCSLAIDSNGIAWAWGYNTSGQLGLGDTNPRSFPVSVAAYTLVRICTGGGSHSLALTPLLTISADFIASTTSIFPNQSVTFTDLSTGAIVSWNWNFGDGTTSALQNPAKIYSASGYYTITLTVSDGINSDTKVKNNYIHVNLVGVRTKTAYIRVSPALKTWDFGPPPERIDMSIAIAKGTAMYTTYKKGARANMLLSEAHPFDSGFTRKNGPAIVFD